MSAPTKVGGASVEFTADLATFAESAKAQLTEAMESPALRDTVTAGFEKASAGVGDVGKQAADQFAVNITEGGASITRAATEVGEAASTGMAEGVEAGSAKVTAATEASVTEAGAAAKTKAAEEGAETGGAFQDGMLENLKGLATAAVPLLGVLAGGELVKSSLEAADQLEGANIKIENVFGESGGAVKKWASGVAGSLRESQLQAETTAGTFGSFLSGLGVSKEDSAGLSENLTSLAANMAAFNNADPASVQQALEGALKGRTASLKQYGVTLTDAQVQQEALSHATELGLTVTNGTVGPLNTQQKALATLYAVMDATKNQQGALASTSDTLKAKQQVLSAEFDNFRATLGTYLLPILAKVAGYIVSDVIPALITVGKWIQQNEAWIKPLAIAIGLLVAAWLAWKLGVAAWSAITKEAKEVQAAFNLVMDANPIMLVVLAVAALAAGLVYAYEHSATFRAIVQAAFKDVKAAAVDVANFFTKDIPAAFNKVVAFLRQWGPLILTIIAPFIGIPLLIIQHWSVIEKFFSGIWSDITGYFDNAISWLEKAGEDIINGLWTGIKTIWALAVDFYVKLPLTIAGYFLNAVTWLAQEGKDIMTGLWGGIHSIWDNEVTGFENIGTTVEGWFKNADQWLITAGEDLINGLVKGIKNVAGNIGKAIKSAVGDIPGASSVLGAIGLATGGLVTKPTFAMVGEAGPELVLPLSQLNTPNSPAVRALTSVAGQANPSGAVAQQQQTGTSARPIEIHEHVYQQPGQDPASMAADISRRTARQIRVAA